MSEENKVGDIHISVTDTDVQYETEFDLPEVLFWLDVLKAMLLKKVLGE